MYIVNVNARTRTRTESNLIPVSPLVGEAGIFLPGGGNRRRVLPRESGRMGEEMGHSHHPATSREIITPGNMLETCSCGARRASGGEWHTPPVSARKHDWDAYDLLQSEGFEHPPDRPDPEDAPE